MDRRGLALTLLALGFFLMLAGAMLLALASYRQYPQGASFGGVLLIGPFPLVFGSGPQGPLLALLAVLALLVVLAALLLLALSTRGPPAGEAQGGGDEEGKS